MASTTDQLHITEKPNKKNKKRATFIILHCFTETRTPRDFFSLFQYVGLKQPELVQQKDATFDKGNLYRSVLLIKPFCASYAFHRVNRQMAQDIL